MIEKGGRKLFWDLEHRTTTDCIARILDLTLEDTSKKTILSTDMACSNEYNKVDKRDEKMTKYHRSCFELLEQGEGYTLKVIPTIIGCLGGGIKELKGSIRQNFEYNNNDKERKMQKNAKYSTMRKQIPDKVSAIGTGNRRFFDLTNKFL